MAETVQDWAARAATLPGELVRATPAAVSAGGRVLEAATRVNLLAASGGDGRLSRVRSGRGARVDVAVKVRGTGSTAEAVVIREGPVSLLQGTAGHREPFQYLAERSGGARSYSMARRRKANRRGQYDRRGLVYIPGVGPRQFANHPGTKGQAIFSKAWDTAREAAGQAGAEVFVDAIRRHFAD